MPQKPYIEDNTPHVRIFPLLTTHARAHSFPTHEKADLPLLHLSVVLVAGWPAKAEPGLNERDMKKADELARETATWFDYTIGPMNTEHGTMQ